MRSFTLYDMFLRNARIYGSDTALVDGRRRISFEQLLTQVEWAASGLVNQGIKKGDRIAVLANNHYRFFILFGAASKSGAILVPINRRLSSEEIEHILKDSKPKLIFSDMDYASKIEEIAAKVLPDAKIILLDASTGKGLCMDDIMSSEPVFTEPAAGDDPFCIIYTAAVEGSARGAVLSQANMVFSNIQLAATLKLGSDDAYINMVPLFHITGLNLSLSVMHMGGRNVILKKFDEKKVIEQTEKEKITVWGSFPPMLARLVEAFDSSSCDISCLRHVVGLDGPDNINPFEEKTNGKFWILYGQTETTGFVTLSHFSEKPGSAGKQCPLTCFRLVDENDEEVPVGEQGEIVIRGPLVFQGFWKMDKINRKTFRGGWHHTGDMGQLDEDGYLWFKGRKPEKELIKPGGENVYPAEVESVILEHPDIDEVCVIGVPDPKFGEGIKAVCVPVPGSSVTEDEIPKFVASKIASYKKPRYVRFANELLKTKDGLTDRNKVKELYGK